MMLQNSWMPAKWKSSYWLPTLFGDIHLLMVSSGPKFSAHILEPLFLQCTGDNIQYLNHFYLLLLWQLCLTPKLTNNSAKAMERKKKGQCSWQTLSDWVRLGRPGKYWHRANCKNFLSVPCAQSMNTLILLWLFSDVSLFCHFIIRSSRIKT